MALTPSFPHFKKKANISTSSDTRGYFRLILQQINSTLKKKKSENLFYK